MRAPDQNAALIADVGIERIHCGAWPDDVGRLGEVRFAWSAIIIEPIGKIDRLLDFKHRQPGPSAWMVPAGL